MLNKHQELMVNSFETYTQNLCQVMSNFEWSKLAPLCQDIYDSIGDDRQVFLCGNGGSGGNAIHLANDYLYPITKTAGKGIKVKSLVDNASILTCLANDEGYERVFSMQLEVLAKQGDILIVFSGSGNSKNILEVLKAAQKMGVKSYAILGFDGGKAKDLADDAIHFQCHDMQISEDLQTICGHMIMQYVYDNIT